MGEIKMKVLFLSAANNIHTIRWVNALTQRGIEIILVSLKNHNHQNTKNKIDSKVKIYYLPFSGMKGYYLNIFSLKKIIKQTKPDLINVHYASGYGTLGRFLKTNKKLLNVWGSDIYDFPNQSKLKKQILLKNLKAFKYIASTSLCMAEETKRFLNSKKTIFITPFGVDTKIFKSLESKKEKKITIGIVKTLKKNYGIEYLIEAFNILCERYKEEDSILYDNLYLEIYGEGELKNDLQNMVKEFELEKKVYFGGYIENIKLPEIINRFDIFCVPTSGNESFGVAAVEAMACEIPVIASNVDGLKEVVVNGQTGFIVPKKNSQKLAQKLDELIKNKTFRTVMGKNGRERVEELYEWEKNVGTMVEIYKKICKN